MAVLLATSRNAFLAELVVELILVELVAAKRLLGVAAMLLGQLLVVQLQLQRLGGVLQVVHADEVGVAELGVAFQLLFGAAVLRAFEEGRVSYLLGREAVHFGQLSLDRRQSSAGGDAAPLLVAHGATALADRLVVANAAVLCCLGAVQRMAAASRAAQTHLISAIICARSTGSLEIKLLWASLSAVQSSCFNRSSHVPIGLRRSAVCTVLHTTSLPCTSAALSIISGLALSFLALYCSIISPHCARRCCDLQT